MNDALQGRRALVTGGDSGIGRGICLELAARGATVAVDHVGPSDAADAVVEEMGSGVAVAMDVAREEDVVRGFAQAAEALGGPIDLLVNNAGIEMPHKLVDMPLDDWSKVLAVNLTGPFLCAREAVRGGMPRGGVIVNISSVHEVIPWETFSHYCATKGGVKLWAASIAKELAPDGIRVVNVAPGAIATPINREVLENAEKSAAVVGEVPLGRWGEVADVARAVAWVASDEAGYVTGTTLFVDGGMTAYPKFV